MRWARHVTCMGRGELHTGFWWGKLMERNHIENHVIDGRITLKCILKK